MIPRRLAVAALLAAAGWSMPANAGPMVDLAIHDAIVGGDYQKAERVLQPRFAAGERSPELMLNLAAVYVLTNRSEAARPLYLAVLGEPDVAMDASRQEGDVVSAHAVARAGLRRIEIVTAQR